MEEQFRFFKRANFENLRRIGEETVGLGPYVDVLHTERPGRFHALDLIEELRPVPADRFIVLLNNYEDSPARRFSKKKMEQF